MLIPNPIGAKQSLFGASVVSAAVTEAEWLKAYKKAIDQNGNPITVAPYSGLEIYGHAVSSLQENIVVKDNKITGKLKYVTLGELPEYWNNNWFIALEFLTFPEDATSVTIRLDPTHGSGEAELINDEERAAAASITPDDNGEVNQKLVVKTTTPNEIVTQVFDLSGLELEEAQL